MKLNNKEKLFHNNTIQYIASQNALCPEFLGDFSNGEYVKPWDGYFAMWFTDEGMEISCNISKLTSVLKAIEKAVNIELSHEEIIRISEEIALTVTKEYSLFIRKYGQDFKKRMLEKPTLH